MTRLWLCVGIIIVTSACESEELSPCELTSIEDGTALAVVTDYTSGALVAFAPECGDAARELAVLSGDAVVRKLGADHAVVLNRSLAASNMLVIGDGLTVETQIDLPDCGPHDAVRLADGRVFVTCYEDDAARVVHLESGVVAEVDMSAVADDDGIPEMDAVARIDDRLYVSLQRLARPDFFSTGPGGVAVLDATSLELLDVDEATAGTQSYDLACDNPFSNWVVARDALYVACASYFPASSSSIVEITTTGTSRQVVTGNILVGVPNDSLAITADGRFVVVVALFDDSFAATATRVLLANDEVAETVYEVPGFSLGGVAIADETVLVADRRPSADAGIYRIEDDGTVVRGLSTQLPPAAIVVY